jgi:NAD(P)-dependent dehydrogenase (short-subunit alcohol dehydrogenase family)
MSRPVRGPPVVLSSIAMFSMTAAHAVETSHTETSMTLAERSYVVTGVSSGIGAAAARQIASEGGRVIGVDRSEPDANIPVTEFYRVDLADPVSIDAFASQLKTPLDGLANVAGASSAAPINVQFDVNFLGTRHLLSRLTPMLSSRASVVNVAAGAGMHWRERMTMLKELLGTSNFDEGRKWLSRHPQDPKLSYARSKEALIMWTLQTAVEWVGSGRRLNAVSPGPVETPMLDEFREIIGKDIIAADVKRSGRAGTAEDIAPVIAFLLRDESRWIHGANLSADGGFSASAWLSEDGWAY